MRHTTLIAAAAVLLCSAPAFAGDLMTGGIPLGNASNLGVISNTAAGIQNKAQQQVMGVQAGGGLAGPFGTASNLGNVSNLAAGVGNKAKQQVFGVQTIASAPPAATTAIPGNACAPVQVFSQFATVRSELDSRDGSSLRTFTNIWINP